MAKFLTRVPGVERGLPEDVEPGALVYSKTITYGNNLPVGGVVYEVVDYDPRTGEAHEDPIVRVIRWNYHPTSPYLYDLALSDIDAETATFFTRACGIEAQAFDRFFAGLKTKRARDDAAHWRPVAAGLAAMASTGTHTPRAQARWHEAHTRQHEDRKAAEPLTEDAAVARAAELTPQLEAAILAARARREA